MRDHSRNSMTIWAGERALMARAAIGRSDETAICVSSIVRGRPQREKRSRKRSSCLRIDVAGLEPAIEKRSTVSTPCSPRSHTDVSGLPPLCGDEPAHICAMTLARCVRRSVCRALAAGTDEPDVMFMGANTDALQTNSGAPSSDTSRAVIPSRRHVCAIPRTALIEYRFPPPLRYLDHTVERLATVAAKTTPKPRAQGHVGMLQTGGLRLRGEAMSDFDSRRHELRCARCTSHSLRSC